MRIVLALVVLAAACGGTKKPATHANTPAGDTESMTKDADGESDPRDEARPDDPDQDGGKAVDDPCAGGE